MEVTDSFYGQVENVCRELYIQSLKEIPPDVVEAIRHTLHNPELAPLPPLNRA